MMFDQRRRKRRNQRRREPDSGFVLVMMALIMVVLLVFAAFVIDIGALYSRTNKLQAAADAAALAAVAHMPGNFAAAQAAAVDAAKANGFVASPPDRTITVSPVASSPRRVKVTLTDRLQPIFGGVVVNSFGAARDAVAEYTPAVPVGSPINQLGGPGMDFMLAVNGFCTAKEDGDRFSSYWEQTRSGNWPATYKYNCGSNAASRLTNTEYNWSAASSKRGPYNYLIHIPCSVPNPDQTVPCPAGDVTTADTHVEVYDPVFNLDPASEDVQPNNFCLNPGYPPGLAEGAWIGIYNATWDPAGTTGKCGVSTFFQMWMPDGTPFNYDDDPWFDYLKWFRPQSCWYHTTVTACGITPGTWVRLYTIPAGSPRGNYRLQTGSEFNEQFNPWFGPTFDSYGVNTFALRAFQGGSFSLCSPPPATCNVAVSGDGTMSLFARANGASPSFYLARLAPASEFRGKQVNIQLWDPGEGGQTVEILAPGSSTGHPFRASLLPPGLSGIPADNTAWSHSGTSLDVSGGPLLAPFCVDSTCRGKPAKFNGRLVQLTINVASNYGLNASGNEVPLADDGWWKIRYNFGATNAQDRTTWTVKLVGSPVHLLP